MEIKIEKKTLPPEKVKEMIEDSERNKQSDAIRRSVLNAAMSYQNFCDIIVKKTRDNSLQFTSVDLGVLQQLYKNGYEQADYLFKKGRGISNL